MIEVAAISAGLIKLPPQKPPPLPDPKRHELLQVVDGLVQPVVVSSRSKLLEAYEIGLAYQYVLDQELYTLKNRSTAEDLFKILYPKKVCQALRYRYVHLSRNLSREMIDEAGERLDIQDALCIARQIIVLGGKEFPPGAKVLRLEWDAALDGCDSAAIRRIVSAVTAEVQARLLANALPSDDELRQIIAVARVETPEQLVQSLLEKCVRGMKNLLKDNQRLEEALVVVQLDKGQALVSGPATRAVRAVHELLQAARPGPSRW